MNGSSRRLVCFILTFTLPLALGTLQGELILHTQKGEAAVVQCLDERDLRDCFWGVVGIWQLLGGGGGGGDGGGAEGKGDENLPRETEATRGPLLLHDRPFILPEVHTRHYYGPDEFGR